MPRLNIITILLSLGFLVSLFLLILCWRQGFLENIWGAKETSSPILDYLEKKKYDEVINEALATIGDEKKDYLMYQTVAQIYLIRAREDAANSSQWINEATTYIEKALSLGPRDVLNLHHATLNFELVGDLADNGCGYYEKALSTSRSELELLQGDEVVVQGYKAPARQIGRDAEGIRERIARKAKAWCE